jgi:RNA polymerase sigma-70 factor (ECF subfamily)
MSRLVLAAQAGDALAMGMLLERHRARLHAVAASMLGPDAEDAVHDAYLTAMRRIGELRDPDAVGAWLTAILVNTCRARLRRPRHEVVTERPLDATLEDAAAELDRAAQRDWLWTALGRLSEPLRLAVMLRHFSAASSYEEIAAVSGVPIGTVRSRLSAARSQLFHSLAETAEQAHVDSRALFEARAETIGLALDRLAEGGGASALAPGFDRRVAFALFDRRPRVGRDHLARLLEGDLEDGVRWTPTALIAGEDITIAEARLINPPEDPNHCPPAVTMVHFTQRGRTRRMVCHYARRP